jgi:hypothetical protein
MWERPLRRDHVRLSGRKGPSHIQGTADGTTTYILAPFQFTNGVFANVSGVPANYTLVYNVHDIELVPTTPIPEPST